MKHLVKEVETIFRMITLSLLPALLNRGVTMRGAALCLREAAIFSGPCRVKREMKHEIGL